MLSSGMRAVPAAMRHTCVQIIAVPTSLWPSNQGDWSAGRGLRDGDRVERLYICTVSNVGAWEANRPDGLWSQVAGGPQERQILGHPGSALGLDSQKRLMRRNTGYVNLWHRANFRRSGWSGLWRRSCRNDVRRFSLEANSMGPYSNHCAIPSYFATRVLTLNFTPVVCTHDENMKGSCLCGAIEYEVDQLDMTNQSLSLSHLSKSSCWRFRINRRCHAGAFPLEWQPAR